MSTYKTFLRSEKQHLRLQTAIIFSTLWHSWAFLCVGDQSLHAHLLWLLLPLCSYWQPQH
ncbi:hypothetical protein B566_EDAN010487, partial [Ephemera danica]